MELIIILLIAVEVVIVCINSPTFELCRMLTVLQCLIRDGPELWHMITNNAAVETQTHEKRKVH